MNKDDYRNGFEEFSNELFELLNRISDEEWEKLFDEYIKNQKQ